jgi:hypothetical protein
VTIDYESLHRFGLRDLIYIGVILTSVVTYLVSSFSKGDVTSRDVLENTKAIANLTEVVRRIDVDGTRHSQLIDSQQQDTINEDRRRIEVNEANYAKIYEILTRIDGKK